MTKVIDKPTNTSDTSDTSDTSSTSNQTPWFSAKLKAIAGLASVSALIFLSRPLMSYFAREMCYNYYGENNWWESPVKGAAKSLLTTYQCEWMGHYGFQWHEALSFISNSWQAIVGTVGSGIGLYSLVKRGQHEGQVPSSDETKIPHACESHQQKGDLSSLFQAIDKGYLPLKETTETKKRLEAQEKKPAYESMSRRRVA